METLVLVGGLEHARRLETFLVEWKRTLTLSPFPQTTSLETFLVEWKHASATAPSLAAQPLKPS